MSTFLARVKKEPGAPPSLKKARRLTEDAVLQLKYQAPDDSEEFPGLKAVELASFNEVQSGSLNFALAWSRKDAKKAETERALCLGLYVTWTMTTTLVRASGAVATTARAAALGR
jgi:hypothetical protein